MTGYFISLISVSALISLAIALSYKPEGDGGALRGAFAVILLYVTLIPLFSAFSDFDIEKIKFEQEKYNFEDKNYIDETAEDAFARGIRIYISEEFSLEDEDINVELFAFDAQKMKAEKIVVTLSGPAAHADFRAIREKLRRGGFENCEVKIEN